MARKRVVDLDTDQVLKFDEKGQKYEGYYIGAKTVKAEFGPTLLHVFQSEGQNQGLWGSAKLDDKLSRIPAGFKTFITYEGKVKIPGGKTMHKFDVEYDDEDSIDVAGANITFQEPEAEQDEVPVAAEEIDEVEAAAEDDATETADDEAEPAPVKAKSSLKAPLTSPTKKTADGVSNLLSKRPGVARPTSAKA